MRRALSEAGFANPSVKKGRRLNRMIRGELKSVGRKYIEMARDLSPEDQELLVCGMLMENVITKTDKGVMSAKALGSD